MNKNDLRKVRDALAKSAEHLDSPPAYVIATVAILDAELAADPQPVGVYLGKKDDDCGEREECLTWNPIPVGTKLYTAPPSREWQGLSADEIQRTIEVCQTTVSDPLWSAFAEAIEAALKEKNHG